MDGRHFVKKIYQHEMQSSTYQTIYHLMHAVNLQRTQADGNLTWGNADKEDSENESGKWDVAEQLAEEQEKERIAIYQQHVRLIEKSIDCHSVEWFKTRIADLKALSAPISRFGDSEYQGIPISRKEKTENYTLFHSITKNTYLSNHEKTELLALALDHGYVSFYQLLLSSPLFQSLSGNHDYHYFFRKLYLYHFNENGHGGVLEEGVENAIWKMFFEAMDNSLFHAIWKSSSPNPAKLIQCITSWLNHLTTADNVVETCDYIEFLFNRYQRSTEYLSEVQRLGKQRILDIEFENIKTKTESHSVSPEVNAFLNKHRSYFIFGGFGRTTSSTIKSYLDNGDLSQAEALIMKEKVKIENDVNYKLDKQVGEHSTFRI